MGYNDAMRKTIDDIRAGATDQVAGVSLMLLAIAGFLVSLWIVICVVRALMG